MRTQTAPRMALAPAVADLLRQPRTPARDLLEKFVRYGEALLSTDPGRLGSVVEPHARLHDLEAIGMPPGLAGLKVFRQMINTAFPDERAEVLEVEIEGPDVISAQVKATGTHRGELMGVAATNRVATWLVHARVRFDGDMVAERWDHVDVQGLLAQITT